jgi:membrane fusion protein (multidrug efflux system)
VSVITVHPQTVPFDAEYIGQGISPYDVEVLSQVTGTIVDRPMVDGADIQAGDILFVIDDVPFESALANAKARVAQGVSTLENNKRTLERFDQLLSKKAISQKDYDDAQTAVLTAEAVVNSAKADVVKAEWDLANTKIKSPVSGRLGKANFSVGALVKAQTDILVRLQQFDPLWVTFTIPETAMLQMQRDIAAKRIIDADAQNFEVHLTFADGTDYEHSGKMNFADVNVRSDMAAVESRATFPNPNKKLLPGQFFRLRISGPKKTGVYLVPQRAVQINPTNKIVYVVGADNKIEAREVQTGQWYDNSWVIEGGSLHAGDRVVVDGVQFITPGATVVTKDFVKNGQEEPK